MATYLDRILEHHRARAAEDGRAWSDLVARCDDLPPARGFVAAVRASASLAVIAEVKRASPSKGPLNPNLDPAEWARTYADAGASCLSVLTDTDHFGGSAQDLQAARAAVTVPVLRKDFTVCAADVADARLMGADAVLLIVAALSDGELEEFDGIAASIGLDVLVETHDEHEVERALAHTRSELIGVNQRDLVSFSVDTDRAVRVASSIPDHFVKVAESGVDGPSAARRLADAGYDAVLVGEHLVTSAQPADTLGALRVPRPAGDPASVSPPKASER